MNDSQLDGKSNESHWIRIKLNIFSSESDPLKKKLLTLTFKSKRLSNLYPIITVTWVMWHDQGDHEERCYIPNRTRRYKFGHFSGGRRVWPFFEILDLCPVFDWKIPNLRTLYSKASSSEKLYDIVPERLTLHRTTLMILPLRSFEKAFWTYSHF